MPSSRRAFLKTFLSGTGCFAAAAAFPFAPSEPARPNGDADVHFPQGVASGDPTPDSILLWTRVQRADAPTEHPVPLVVQVSRRRLRSVLSFPSGRRRGGLSTRADANRPFARCRPARAVCVCLVSGIRGRVLRSIPHPH
ncbi:PhoD-like phosphatase N-terminal domain-containing protein [Salinibacter ruber]|uniref:PhoD-like phosphatase N-terminal domain-containing protein n=1 Tax=Salinibacter ruber TaxID=146919 RepID=UPI003C6DFD66